MCRIFRADTNVSPSNPVLLSNCPPTVPPPPAPHCDCGSHVPGLLAGCAPLCRYIHQHTARTATKPAPPRCVACFRLYVLFRARIAYRLVCSCLAHQPFSYTSTFDMS